MLTRTRTMRELLRERARQHQQDIQKRDEMIQSLLDRIQHPERTPIWREAPVEPLEPLVWSPDNLIFGMGEDG